MKSFGIRLGGGVLGSMLSAPFFAGGGALAGYIYAKLADLPVNAAVKAYAIWPVAEAALITIASTFTENPKHQAFIRTAIVMMSTVFGIRELKKRSLIGDKMTACLIIVRTIGILLILKKAKG